MRASAERAPRADLGNVRPRGAPAQEIAAINGPAAAERGPIAPSRRSGPPRARQFAGGLAWRIAKPSSDTVYSLRPAS